MPKASVLRRLPTLEQVERELSRNSRERRLLRAFESALRRKQKLERAGRRLASHEVRHGQ
jgi:hypothetical protein